MVVYAMNATLLLAATLIPLNSCGIAMPIPDKIIYIATDESRQSKFVEHQLKINNWCGFSKSNDDIFFLQNINRLSLHIKHRWRFEFVDKYDQRYPSSDFYPMFRLENEDSWECFPDHVMINVGDLIHWLAWYQDRYYYPLLVHYYSHMDHVRCVHKFGMNRNGQTFNGLPIPPQPEFDPDGVETIWSRMNKFTKFTAPEPHIPYWYPQDFEDQIAKKKEVLHMPQSWRFKTFMKKLHNDFTIGKKLSIGWEYPY